MSRIAVIIVTHNSEGVLNRCLTALLCQSQKVQQILLVDSASDNPSYVERLAAGKPNIRVLALSKNVGFARANNAGYDLCDSASEYILFLNPDAFPAENALERAAAFLRLNPDVACVGGRLLGWDPGQNQATGLLDSTGLFRKWYGRWYDRGQGQPDCGQFDEIEEVAAACGAFMFCRRKALEQIRLSDGSVFDPGFFLYKEDIELCLRFRKAGRRIVYQPEIRVFHCRGWQARQRMPYALRKVAAESEVYLYRRHPSPFILWALVKYLLVLLLRV